MNPHAPVGLAAAAREIDDPLVVVGEGDNLADDGSAGPRDAVRPAKSPDDWPELVVVGLSSVSLLLRQRGGAWERWALTEEEVATVGPPTAAVLAKYAGSAPASLELTCVLAWAMYAIPRLLEARPEEPKEKGPPAELERDRAHLEQPVKMRAVPAPKEPPGELTLEQEIALGGPI